MHDNQVALLDASAHLIERQQDIVALLEASKRDTVLQSEFLKQTNDSLLLQIEILKRDNATIRGQLASGLEQMGDAYLKRNPEACLLGHLYGYLSDRVALDVGANIGELSETLISAGYTVYAFEPYTPVFKELTERLATKARFHAFNIAIGDADGKAPLHLAEGLPDNKQTESVHLYNSLIPHSMPIGLQFSSTVEVSVRSLESLRVSLEIPADIGVLKIDTEGNELSVIRGLGDLKPSVVMAEFWDERHVFGREKTLNKHADLITEMQRLGYDFNITIYRTTDPERPKFFCSYHRPPDSSWGNVLFFRERAIYEASLYWCNAFL